MSGMNSSMNPSYADRSLEEARRAVDDQVASLEETLRKLRSDQNKLTLINRLPEETLIRVFMNLVEPLRRSTRLKPPRRLRPAWLSVCQVFHAWRDLALGYGPLWASISPLYGGEWVKEMAARSRGSHLTLDTRGVHGRTEHTIDGEEIYNVAVSHAGQVAHIVFNLRIGSLSSADLGDWMDLIPQLPELERLTFQDWDGRTAFFYPSNASETMHLRTLEIGFHAFAHQPHPIELLSRLESLTVYNAFTFVNHYAFGSLLALLTHTKALRSLTVRSFHDLSSAPGTQPRVVDLPMLYHLHLQNTPSVCDAILSHLKLPPRASLALVISSSVLYRDSIDDCMKLIHTLGDLSTHTGLVDVVVGKGYLTWIVRESGVSDTKIQAKLGGFLDSASVRRRGRWQGPGVHGWFALISTVSHIDKLVLSGPTGLNLFVQLLQPDMSRIRPPSSELVFQDMGYSSYSHHLVKWLELKGNLGQSAPMRIKLAGDPLDELVNQLQRMCGSAGFAVYNGDKVIKASLGPE